MISKSAAERRTANMPDYARACASFSWDDARRTAIDGLPEEIVRVFVSLNPGWTESPDLTLEILGFARRRLGAALSPKSVDFVESLPKNRAGKIMRRVLKARALGLAEGDLSTLEPEAARP